MLNFNELQHIPIADRVRIGKVFWVNVKNIELIAQGVQQGYVVHLTSGKFYEVRDTDTIAIIDEYINYLSDIFNKAQISEKQSQGGIEEIAPPDLT